MKQLGLFLAVFLSFTMAEAADAPAGIEVEGVGVVSVVPDRFSISASINARAKAEAIAAGSGATIAGVRRVRFGDGVNAPRFDRDEIVVTASRITRPKIRLDLDPQPIDVRAEVLAEFSLR